MQKEKDSIMIDFEWLSSSLELAKAKRLFEVYTILPLQDGCIATI